MPMPAKPMLCPHKGTLGYTGTDNQIGDSIASEGGIWHGVTGASGGKLVSKRQASVKEAN